MAGKGGKRSTSWQPGQSGNPKGSSAAQAGANHSLHWHVTQRFNDADRAKAIDAQVIRARAGDEKSLELLAKLAGESRETAQQTTNILAVVAGGSETRGLAQQFFAALAMGLRDAGGVGVVREPSELGALAAPDED